MVAMELSTSDLALIDAAEQHRFTCRKCSKAVTISPRERICLQGLLHYSKVMRMFRMNAGLTAQLYARMPEDTP